MILTHSFVVGGKGYKSGVNASTGKSWQLQSFKAFPFDEYVSVMLPPFVQVGTTVTVAGTVKREQNGEYINYSLQYPTIDTVYRPEPDNQPAQPSYSPPAPDPFAGGGNPMDISDDQLPF